MRSTHFRAFLSSGTLARLGADRATYQQKAFRRMGERLRPYRNFLVHDHPVLVQNEYLPKVESIKLMSGLTVISRVARKGELLEIENPKYGKDQLSPRPEDRELTVERILWARELG